jgi:hypothetical protein
MPSQQIARALELLYALLDDSDRLGLSRAARLRLVAVVGELEAAGAERPHSGSSPGDDDVDEGQKRG